VALSLKVVAAAGQLCAAAAQLMVCTSSAPLQSLLVQFKGITAALPL
jgi:hypothetical protein